LTRKQKRLAIIAGFAAVLAVATTLVLVALRDQIVFFYSPSEVAEKAVAPGTPIRLGGLVQEGSWKRTGETNDFIVTDGESTMMVHYVGILPDLFKEGQGVVAEGAMTAEGTFAATNVLAKHDENYMPKEVVDALKERGEWQREGAPL
jgi:cytochrome c-type biogenesis protein CcmE